MNGDPRLYKLLDELHIGYEYFEHPPAPTIEVAKQYWAGHDAKHCKNLFFRNHKGNQHYLVILDCDRNMNIRDIEQKLRQGKLTFASEERMVKYLGVHPGSVTPFALINDADHHVRVFLDEKLLEAEKVSFHPCINTASLIIAREGLVRFLDRCGNAYEWVRLY